MAAVSPQLRSRSRSIRVLSWWIVMSSRSAILVSARHIDGSSRMLVRCPSMMMLRFTRFENRTWWTSDGVRSGSAMSGGTPDRVGRGALLRAVIDARPVPIALGADQHQMVGFEAQRIGRRRDLAGHRHIFMVGEVEFAILHRLEDAEARPERHQPLLGVAVEAGDALAGAEVEGKAGERKGDATLLEALRAEPLQNSEALGLGKIAEIPDSHGAGRLAPDGRQDVRRGVVVAVEFLVIRRALLADEHDGADIEALHHVVEGSRDLDRDPGALCGCAGMRLTHHLRISCRWL